jgi:competence protein ComEC
MFKVDFLNVGHGDCTVIEHNSGRITMIDINNGSIIDVKTFSELTKYYTVSLQEHIMASVLENNRNRLLYEKGYDIKLTNPVDFMVNNYPRKSIFRYIQTHPHLDHMRGLYDLQISHFDITNFWYVKHDFKPELITDSDRNNWSEYEQQCSGNRNNTALQLYQGSQGRFFNNDEYNSGGDGFEILWPTQDYINGLCNQGDTNPNNISYILKLSYNGIVFIFGGDAEEEVWKTVASTYGKALKCNVFKASHHGRDSGYCKEAIELMRPEYTIVSVGNKPENDASNKYKNYSDNVWSTRWKGNISFTHNGYGWAINSEYDR